MNKRPDHMSDLESLQAKAEEADQASLDDQQSDEDIPFRSLEEEAKEESRKNKKGQKEGQKSSDMDAGHSAGYVRQKERDFNTLTNEKETDQELEELAAHKKGKKRPRKKKPAKSSGLFGAIKRLVHMVHVTFLADKELEVELEYEKQQERERKISNYRYHAIRAPGDQAGQFDDKFEKGKGKKTLATFFELDPAMDGMAMYNQIGLTMGMSKGLSQEKSKEHEVNQEELGQLKVNSRYRDRDLELERLIKRDIGRGR